MEEPGRFSPFAGMTRIRFKGFGLSPSQPRFGAPLEQHQCGPADSGCQQGPYCNAAPCRRGLRKIPPIFRSGAILTTSFCRACGRCVTTSPPTTPSMWRLPKRSAPRSSRATAVSPTQPASGREWKWSKTPFYPSKPLAAGRPLARLRAAKRAARCARPGTRLVTVAARIRQWRSTAAAACL